MHFRSPRVLILPFVGIVAAFSTGCSFSIGTTGDPTEPASKIAESASGALADEFGRAPETFDCGDGDIDIVEGNVVDCILTDAGVTIEATVTITEVDGKDYKFAVDVADQPVG